MDYPTVIDPLDDAPDKLIWMLYGWLAWDENPWVYSGQLRELQRMLEYVVKIIEKREAEESRKNKA